MAAVTTNTDTKPAKRGSVDVLESGNHDRAQKPGENKTRREEKWKNIVNFKHFIKSFIL